jgi:tetratricopeptide (TPR) repeat protein
MLGKAPAQEDSKMRLQILLIGIFATITSNADMAEIDFASQANDLEKLLELRAAIEVAENTDQFESAYLGYRLAIVYMTRQNGDEATTILDDVIESLAKDTIADDEDADSLALLSAATGLRISLSPLVSGMSLGPKSEFAIQRAIGIDPDNPTIWLVRGIGLYNTPEMFGGSADKALDALNRSIEQFDTGVARERQWGHADAYIWRGIVRQSLGDRDLARNDYSQALVVSPDYHWAQLLLGAVDAAAP